MLIWDDLLLSVEQLEVTFNFKNASLQASKEILKIPNWSKQQQAIWNLWRAVCQSKDL